MGFTGLRGQLRRVRIASMTPLRLVADVGGTNARFALYDPRSACLLHARTLAAVDHPDIAASIATYLADLPAAADAATVAEAALAVASPVRGDEVAFTNSPWRFSRSALASRLGWRRLLVLNDFEALALGVPYLAAAQLVTIRNGVADPTAPRAVLGPGTGLGVSGLVRCGPDGEGGHWVALAGEGGHVGFAPTDELEIDLLRFLARRHARASVERVLCGDGLGELYAFLAGRAGLADRRLEPAQVTLRALEQADPVAQAALQLFCAILGSVAGDLALTLGARGGVYLGGGILPRIVPTLLQGRFVERFLAKGRMSAVLEPVPVQLIVDPAAALRGAAAALA
jgi:glucokinase